MGDMVSALIDPVTTIGIAVFLLRLWNEKDRAHGKSGEYLRMILRMIKRI